MTLSEYEINKLKSFYKNKKEVFGKSINYTKYSWTRGVELELRGIAIAIM